MLCQNKTVSSYPDGYNPQPGDPSPPFPTLTTFFLQGHPNNFNLAVLECLGGGGEDDEPVWNYYNTG